MQITTLGLLPSIRAAGWLLLAVLLFVLNAFGAPKAHGQRAGTLLIISDQSRTGGKGSPLDLAPYVERKIRETGAYEVVIFKPDSPEVRTALETRKLTSMDIMQPFTTDVRRKIAAALNATHILILSGRFEPEGVTGDAEMEALSGPNTWTTVLSYHMGPYRGKTKKPSVLAGVMAFADNLSARLTGKPSPSAPSAPKTGPEPPHRKPEPTPTSTSAPPPIATRPPELATVTSPHNGPLPSTLSPVAKPSAYEILITRARNSGDIPNLIVSLRRTINEKPRDPVLRRDLIQAYAVRGLREAAHAEALRAVALMPEDATLRRLLGDTYLDAGDVENAVKQYVEAVRLAPGDATNLVALGDAYWNLGKPEEALKAFARAATVDPRNPLPHRKMARLFALRGEYPAAVHAMKSASALTTEGDSVALNANYADLLRAAESTLNDLLARLQNTRKVLQEGMRTREEVFQDTLGVRKRAEDIVGFLETLPSPSLLERVQAYYGQAASLVVQAAEATMRFLETQEERYMEEALLLRVEAGKQMTEAANRLKALSPSQDGK
ncbi:MAG TPA: tetratricopeptide repeat protein [Chthonomonadales bacterium]|nr:tetratricopeptide repeat protein [Chthonomonadales bacterium]